ncbi:glycosyl transferase, family 9 [Candidatus Moduliflexus flocculans]|uniref:Glycosyl transferase, family 9 n=1 Tax=Candidatus Moduliflexus flocculans TaxID=1499966 RepID=A0A0S6VQU6_9BACT|nr:glycosyl transferase, family 9 [Candidatus Moduliflexus flocculans]
MQLSKKVFIDRLLGRLLCFILIPFVRLIGILLRRDHSIHDGNTRCIAVAKYYGLGSIIHATPMLRALKQTYPEARVIFLTRQANQDLFAHLVDVDEVLFVEDRTFLKFLSSNFRICLTLIMRRVDLFFDLELFSAYGALVSLSSLARNRIGFFCGKDTDFKTWIYTHLIYFNFQMPVRFCYLQLARVANVSQDVSTELTTLIIPDELREAARSKLNAIVKHRGNGLIAINVNASELSLERRWLPERFAEVIRHFSSQNYTLLLVGSRGEQAYAQQVAEMAGEVGERVHNVAGEFVFSEFLALLQECDALLTNDSGIMNFGYALHVPTLSLFGPCHPAQYHIPSNMTRYLYQPVFCSPCVHLLYEAPCKGRAYCMAQIETSAVITQLEALLRGTVFELDAPLMPSILLSTDSSVLGLLRAK